MKINLWYCKDMNLWRWSLIDDRRPICKQETGQREDLKLAMQDIANTVEYLIEEK
jgi:hypothetical protein